MGDLKINIKQKISQEHVEEIIVTALEGGSNYWYLIKTNLSELKQLDGKTVSESIAINLFNDPTYSLEIYDAEDEDELLGTLTQESLIKGLEICHKDYNESFNDLLEGTGDAETADVIFQLSVMGEIVFG